MAYNYDTRNWFGYGNYRDFDKDFRADLGFITQVNNDQLELGGGRVFYSENKWWNRFEMRGNWEITHDNDGELLERELEGRIEVNGSLQSYMNLRYVKKDRLFDGNLFKEVFLNSYMQFTPKRGLLLETGLTYGDVVDFTNSRLAKRTRINPGIHLSVNKHTQLFLHHTYNRLDTVGVRDQVANLSDLRLIYQFNTRSFLRLTAQYQNIENIFQDSLSAGTIEKDRSFNKQLLYSYKVNPRTVFFLGYSDLATADNQDPKLEVQQRGLFMKLGYVFDY